MNYTVESLAHKIDVLTEEVRRNRSHLRGSTDDDAEPDLWMRSALWAVEFTTGAAFIGVAASTVLTLFAVVNFVWVEALLGVSMSGCATIAAHYFRGFDRKRRAFDEMNQLLTEHLKQLEVRLDDLSGPYYESHYHGVGGRSEKLEKAREELERRLRLSDDELDRELWSNPSDREAVSAENELRRADAESSRILDDDLEFEEDDDDISDGGEARPFSYSAAARSTGMKWIKVFSEGRQAGGDT